ncbi:ComEA family DNA-binding protein [Vibrio algicola]|uniref:Transporter n=1 Tax=Vibrio algicola TaxID=2662262 RepID=A0A5Q0TGF9_9VIBR|nr:ComEA family DNA-binding protein [Vibrio algicola]
MRILRSLCLLLMVTFLPMGVAVAADTDAQHEGIEITVNVNTADANEIATMLKGIGEKKAQQIVDFRTENGKFKDLESLKQVKGIGQSTIDKNKDRILL